eukprot:4884419-Pyramimonas_sp.AAC.1
MLVWTSVRCIPKDDCLPFAKVRIECKKKHDVCYRCCFDVVYFNNIAFDVAGGSHRSVSRSAAHAALTYSDML